MIHSSKKTKTHTHKITPQKTPTLETVQMGLTHTCYWPSALQSAKAIILQAQGQMHCNTSCENRSEKGQGPPTWLTIKGAEKSEVWGSEWLAFQLPLHPILS